MLRCMMLGRWHIHLDGPGEEGGGGGSGCQTATSSFVTDLWEATEGTRPGAERGDVGDGRDGRDGRQATTWVVFQHGVQEPQVGLEAPKKSRRNQKRLLQLRLASEMEEGFRIRIGVCQDTRMQEIHRLAHAHLRALQHSLLQFTISWATMPTDRCMVQGRARMSRHRLPC